MGDGVDSQGNGVSVDWDAMRRSIYQKSVERGLRVVLDELAGTTGTCWRLNRYVWPEDISKLVEIFQKAAKE